MLCVHNAQVKQTTTWTWNKPDHSGSGLSWIYVSRIWVHLECSHMPKKVPSSFWGLKGTNCENTLKVLALILTEVFLHCHWFPFFDAMHLNQSFSFHHWQKDVKLICDLKFMSQISSYLKVPLSVSIMQTGRGARSARVTPVPVRGFFSECIPTLFHPHLRHHWDQCSHREGFHFISYKTLFENIKREIRWCNTDGSHLSFLDQKKPFLLLVNLE